MAFLKLWSDFFNRSIFGWANWTKSWLIYDLIYKTFCHTFNDETAFFFSTEAYFPLLLCQYSIKKAVAMSNITERLHFFLEAV